ncbi:hypothetical protein [Convivina intestini]|uniref:hypothetical protein n=1 Tax=Convivina intestini TaxID=1505726 RepID=UPI00200BDAC0|nr:hypothetical protein [Convivina intestini]CAH1851614.1 hypothetical protein R078131_00298 [Convivina intestini]
MKVNDMIESNNFLREKLNPENKKYYENLLMYVRLSSWHHTDQAIETYLLSVLQDILDAQSDGQTAEDYFGQNPKHLADEFLAQLPNSPWSALKLALIIYMSYIFMSLLPALIIPDKGVDLGNLILSSFYLLLLVWLGDKFLANIIYSMQSIFQHRWLNILSLWLGSSLVAGSFFLVMFILKTPLVVKFFGWTGIIVIIILMAILIVVGHIFRDKKLSLPLTLFGLVLGGLGILTRMPKIGSYLTQDATGKLVLAGILCLLFIGFEIAIWLSMRAIKKVD